MEVKAWESEYWALNSSFTINKYQLLNLGQVK